jgi:hypothetical protein
MSYISHLRYGRNDFFFLSKSYLTLGVYINLNFEILGDKIIMILNFNGLNFNLDTIFIDLSKMSSFVLR